MLANSGKVRIFAPVKTKQWSRIHAWVKPYSISFIRVNTHIIRLAYHLKYL